jgi:GNAT superfamily N-acetyltransferase
VTATAAPWVVREATRDDLPRLGRLFVESFGFERDLAHTAWKFFDNPVGRPLLVVAESDDRLVGQYALWPVELRIGGEVVLGAQSLDTMTHPDFRGQGMFPRLASACMDLAVDQGVRVLYGFPNANSYAGFVRKLNWDHTGDVPFLVRPLKPSAHSRVPGGLGWLADLGARLLPRRRGGGWDLLQSEPTAAERAALWNGPWLPARGTCSIHRSQSWEAWRFAPASRMSYRWLSVRRDGELAGYVCWGSDIRGPNALLSEICATDDGVLDSLIGAVITDARSRGHAFLTTATTVRAVIAALRRNGFLRRTSLPFIVRSLSHKLLAANVHSHDAWQLVGADLDTY